MVGSQATRAGGGVKYRNRKVLDLAHEIHECQIRIPGVCRGYSPEGCEPAHGNWSWTGIGMATKSHDVFAASCHECHVALDTYQHMTRAEAEQYWSRGAIRTWIKLMKDGRLTLA